MATQQISPLTWTVIDGRDGYSTPLQIPASRGAEVLNMQFNGALGKKRDGSVEVATINNQGWFALYTFFPDQTSPNAWLVVATKIGVSHVPGFLIFSSGPSTPTTPPLKDQIQNTVMQLITFTTHGGQLFIAYDSAVNRLHRYGPIDAGFVNRAGLAPPGTFAVTNTGVGTYPAILRYYRVQWLTISASGVTLRMSNLSAPVSFTPSGVNAAAHIVMPTLIGEGETHWIVHASADDLAYYQLSGPLDVITTNFFDDATLPVNYALLPLSPLEGANTPFPSVKFLGSDGRHLFGFGVWETTAGDSLLPVPGRVYFTPAIGSTDTGDTERVSNTLESRGWIDCSPANGAGSIDRGISGPMNNRMYVFQSFGIYMLIPTGDAITPFARSVLTTAYGSLSHWSQILGEDENGQPALYFLDPRDGPRRISLGSTIQWLGREVSDLWATVNVDSAGPPFGLYDQLNKLVKWWVATGTSNTPDTMIVYDVTRGHVTEGNELRGGWIKWTGQLAAANCATMYFKVWAVAAPFATTQMVPYVGLTNLVLVKQDGTTNADMVGATVPTGLPFQSYVRSAVFTGQTLRRQKRLMEAFLFAKVSAATLTQSVIRDMGAQTITSTHSLAATGTETWKRTFFDATDVADLTTLQIQLGDGSAIAQFWELGEWQGGQELEPGAR